MSSLVISHRMRKKKEQLALEKEREYWDPLRNSSLNMVNKLDTKDYCASFYVYIRVVRHVLSRFGRRSSGIRFTLWVFSTLSVTVTHTNRVQGLTRSGAGLFMYQGLMFKVQGKTI